MIEAPFLPSNIHVLQYCLQKHHAYNVWHFLLPHLLKIVDRLWSTYEDLGLAIRDQLFQMVVLHQFLGRHLIRPLVGWPGFWEDHLVPVDGAVSYSMHPFSTLQI